LPGGYSAAFHQPQNSNEAMPQHVYQGSISNIQAINTASMAALSQQDIVSQSAVSQGGFSSKSPNSKQFHAHEQHLNNLFDTLKKR